MCAFSVLCTICFAGVDEHWSYNRKPAGDAEDMQLLRDIAIAGKGGVPMSGKDTNERSRIKALMERDSDSTVIHRVGADNVRIHNYHHALYLHGVKGPNEPNVEDKIKEVKEKF